MFANLPQKVTILWNLHFEFAHLCRLKDNSFPGMPLQICCRQTLYSHKFLFYFELFFFAVYFYLIFFLLSFWHGYFCCSVCFFMLQVTCRRIDSHHYAKNINGNKRAQQNEPKKKVLVKLKKSHSRTSNDWMKNVQHMCCGRQH